MRMQRYSDNDKNELRALRAHATNTSTISVTALEVPLTVAPAALLSFCELQHACNSNASSSSSSTAVYTML
jgi:hypothetical protein